MIIARNGCLLVDYTPMAHIQNDLSRLGVAVKIIIKNTRRRCLDDFSSWRRQVISEAIPASRAYHLIPEVLRVLPDSAALLA